ncbi:hypothetical protein ACQ5SO_21100 [Rhodovulum sp. DZ06]|uniref:hypothetical protein n=1 Tax=Rhodovulum sp. DZ06 TaxID=3425126 RepID=UPI003D33A2C8
MPRFENWILLTATITPMAKANVTLRADPAQRLQDYEEALRFYLTRPGGKIDGIYFLENSDSDLSSLRAIARDENPRNIPVVFFSALADCDPELGKGHSELQLMDRCFEAHIAGKPETHRVWKITGRLKIQNIEKLIEKAPDGFGVYIDMRLVPSYLKGFGTDRWADTRIIGFTPEGYRGHFHGKKAIVGTQGPMSHVVELALFPPLYDAWKQGDAIAPRFTVQPIMLGVGAESLKDYNDASARLKNLIRSATRTVAPGLWL